MSAIGKGSMVECIKLPQDSSLTIGKIYEVQDILFSTPKAPRGLWVCLTCGGKLRELGCLVLVGVPVSPAGLGHCPCHFRPAGKKGDFDDLLKRPFEHGLNMPLLDGVHADKTRRFDNRRAQPLKRERTLHLDPTSLGSRPGFRPRRASAD